MAPWCSGYHYCTTSFNKVSNSAQAQTVLEICDGENLWQWFRLEIRRKHLSSVKHTIKTIHHHHDHHHHHYNNIIWFFKLNTSKKSSVDCVVIVVVTINDWLVHNWAWGFLVAIVLLFITDWHKKICHRIPLLSTLQPKWYQQCSIISFLDCSL